MKCVRHTYIIVVGGVNIPFKPFIDCQICISWRRSESTLKLRLEAKRHWAGTLKTTKHMCISKLSIRYFMNYLMFKMLSILLSIYE